MYNKELFDAAFKLIRIGLKMERFTASKALKKLLQPLQGSSPAAGEDVFASLCECESVLVKIDGLGPRLLCCTTQCDEHRI